MAKSIESCELSSLESSKNLGVISESGGEKKLLGRRRNYARIFSHNLCGCTVIGHRTIRFTTCNPLQSRRVLRLSPLLILSSLIHNGKKKKREKKETEYGKKEGNNARNILSFNARF